MRREKKKKDPVILLLDLLIIVLLFVMLFSGARAYFYRSLTDEHSFGQDAGMMSFELQRGDYAALIRGRYVNEFNGETEASRYHALADYVEAASMLKVYAAKHDDDRAQQQRAIMTEAREEMGDLTVFADRVDEMFR